MKNVTLIVVLSVLGLVSCGKAEQKAKNENKKVESERASERQKIWTFIESESMHLKNEFALFGQHLDLAKNVDTWSVGHLFGRAKILGRYIEVNISQLQLNSEEQTSLIVPASVMQVSDVTGLPQPYRVELMNQKVQDLRAAIVKIRDKNIGAGD